MKAYKVFWKHKIVSEGKSSYAAIVVARDISHALIIAAGYGEVLNIAYESEMVILTENGSVLVDPAKAAAAVGETKKQ